jgi:sterol desaturase/sphingolipid hydroxylase (fatty acid hydroxylase superfamily)
MLRRLRRFYFPAARGRIKSPATTDAVDQLRQIFHQCLEALTHGVIALAIGLLVFSCMERMFRFRPLQKNWRATRLDLQYAFLSMLYPPFIYFVLAAIFGILSLQIREARSNSGIDPLWFLAQLAAVLFVRDGLIYLRHRIFHTRPVWPFHSIHHSSEEVNWLSAVRFHPVENSIEATGEILLFLIAQNIGVDALVLSVAGITIGFYNFFIHSNLRWTFGPLGYVFVSPVFHRWHHSDAPEAQDKNFAAMFACLDLVFGTFYLPADKQPVTLGLSPEEKPGHPRTLGRQLLYPFKRRP